MTVPAEKVPVPAAKEKLSRPAPAHDAAPSYSPPGHPILKLQRAIGNRRVAELIRSQSLSHDGRILPLQPKLTVGAVDDPAEREAEHVSHQVLTMPEPVREASPALATQVFTPHDPQAISTLSSLQRHSSPGDGASFDAAPEVEQQLNQSKGQGSPLPDFVRNYMEPRFGADFSHVRVHTGPPAEHMNAAVGAQAFTHGSDIYYGADHHPGQLDLTSHELTHVVQQTGLNRLHRAPAPDPSIKDAGAPIAGAPPAQQPAQATPPPAQTPSSQPSMSQGPIGQVVVPIPDWTFFDQKSTSKAWAKGVNEPLLNVLIPDLAVRVGLNAEASAAANFLASFGPGRLTNIKVGLTYKQALLLGLIAAEEEIPGTGLALDALLLKSGLFGFNDIRALADIHIPAHVALDFAVTGALKAAASAAGLFDIATLEAGLVAKAGASADLNFGGPIGVYVDSGHITFKLHQSLEAQMNLFFSLVANITATLLGFQWSKSWNLANYNLNSAWKLGPTLNLNYNDKADVDMLINDEDKSAQVPGWMKDLMSAAIGTKDFLQALAPAHATPGAGGPGGGGPPGTPGGPGAPGGPAAPTGSEDDPIPMIWYKSPGLYPPSIALRDERLFLTEPAWVHVPPANTPEGRDLADIRRGAGTSGEIELGVAPKSEFYPALQSKWPRTRVGRVRGGVKQAQFRRLLTALGYNWGSLEADHVRDLQWAGQDDYHNLWPLERVHNNAANQVLDQPVTYRDKTGQVVTTELRNTPLGRYFKIDRYG